MATKVRLWGNRLGITIPKFIADQIRLKEGEFVDFKVKDGQIILSKKYIMGCTISSVQMQGTRICHR